MGLRRTHLPIDPATGKPKAVWENNDRAREAVKVGVTTTVTLNAEGMCPHGKCVRRRGHDGDCWPT